MSSQIQNFHVQITHEDNFAYAKVTSEGGADVPAAMLFDMAHAIQFAARIQLLKEQTEHLVIDRCYRYKTDSGWKYVQYKGYDSNCLWVRPITSEGVIIGDGQSQQFSRKTTSLKELAVQPKVVKMS